MGGGAIRTAVKAAAYQSPGLFAGQAAAAAARRFPRPASSAVPSAAPAAEGGPSITLLSSEKTLSEAAPVAAIHRPVLDLDDWEFAGWEEEGELVLDSVQPAPRLVFGSVPTLEEAKEATADLKDALEKVYFSPTTAEYAVSAHQESCSQEASAIVPSMPRQVVQAFSLLQRSPEAQDVVASLASDKNVWDAVLKNEKVMEFYRTHQSVITHTEGNVVSDDSTCNEFPSTTNESSRKSGLESFVQKCKVKLDEFVSKLSIFFQDILGPPAGTSGTNSKTTINNDGSNTDIAALGGFLALAILTILVVLFKRG